MIKFNQNDWLKPYIDTSKDPRKEAKNYFERDFFKLKNNAVFRKTMENERKHRDVELVTTKRTRNYLVSEPNCYSAKFFTKNLLVIETKKAQILMNKSVRLGFSILELSKILMYEFWYDYVKPKHDEKLFYMDTGSFIVNIKTGDVYKDIAEDIETRFGISNYKLDR